MSSKSESFASDLSYSVCSPCKKRGKNVEASHYCQECEQCMCNTCESKHKDVISHHHVLGETNKHRWGRITSSRTDQFPSGGFLDTGAGPRFCCTHNTLRDVDKFCEDHQELCCPKCQRMNHSQCKNLKNLCSIAAGITKRPEYEKLPTRLRDVKANLNEVKEGKKGNMSTLLKTSKYSEEQIIIWETKIIKIVQEIKNKTITELKERTNDLNTNIEDDIKRTDSVISDLDAILCHLQDKMARSDHESFIIFRNGGDILSNAEALLKSIDLRDVKIEFKQDQDIENNLSSKHMLGYFLVSPESVPRVQNVTTYRVKSQQDQKNCDITSACKLENGNLVLVDSRNQKVKQINGSFEIVAEHHLPQFPYRVFPICRDEIAVTVCDWAKRNEIHFLKVKESKFENKKTIALDHDCFDLLSIGDQLYIGSTKGIFMYKTGGEKLGQIYHKEVKAIARSMDGSRLFLLDNEAKVVVIIDKQGKEVSRILKSDLEGPRDLCFGGNDKAFICCYLSNKVELYDKTLTRRLVSVASEKDGLSKPCCLLYDQKNKRLIVGQENEQIVVVEMERM